MSKTSAPNLENLEKLGVTRLAELLLEFSDGNAIAKRQLRYELMSLGGSVEIAKEIRKRIATIARSGSIIEWEDCHAVAHDLLVLKNTIVKSIAPQDQPLAVELLWRLLELDNSIYDRCYSGHENFNTAFFDIAQALGEAANGAIGDKTAFARRIVERLASSSNYGQYHGLITKMASALGQDGLNILNDQVLDYKRLHPNHGRNTAAWLQEIADQLGDVDTYISQFDLEQKAIPANAAAIAFRLLM